MKSKSTFFKTDFPEQPKSPQLANIFVKTDNSVWLILADWTSFEISWGGWGGGVNNENVNVQNLTSDISLISWTSATYQIFTTDWGNARNVTLEENPAVWTIFNISNNQDVEDIFSVINVKTASEDIESIRPSQKRSYIFDWTYWRWLSQNSWMEADWPFPDNLTATSLWFSSIVWKYAVSIWAKCKAAWDHSVAIGREVNSYWNFSTCLWAQQNDKNVSYWTSLWYRSHPRHYGGIWQWHDNEPPSSDNYFGRWVNNWRGETTNGSATKIWLRGISTASFSFSFALGVCTFDMLVTGIDTSTGDTKIFKVTGGIKNVWWSLSYVWWTYNVEVLAEDPAASGRIFQLNLNWPNMEVFVTWEVGKTIKRHVVGNMPEMRRVQL